MLNYSTHAIEGLLEMRPHLRGAEDKAGIDGFINGVRDAAKFEMPDRGRIIYGLGDMPEGLAMTRLPFPEVVLEIPYTPVNSHKGEMIDAPKRLVLAREVVWEERTTCPRPVEYGESPTHVRVDVAYQNERDRKWYLQPVGALVESGAVSGLFPKNPSADPFADQRYGGAAFPLTSCPTLPIASSIVLHDKGPEWYSHMVSNDVGAEVCILAEMLAVLACTNVTTETRPAPEKLVRNRLRNGREPFYDTHLLVLAGRVVTAQGGNISVSTKDEDGFKVREHVRRGHIRRLSDGRTVWVNNTLVAAGSKSGRSDKTYSVKG
jgi:hypothetical protein